jgi:hypothetical protein
MVETSLWYPGYQLVRGWEMTGMAFWHFTGLGVLHPPGHGRRLVIHCQRTSQPFLIQRNLFGILATEPSNFGNRRPVHLNSEARIVSEGGMEG